jgi:hypothetical protein
MDRERAKFVLRSFRPDGEDADEPAFAEALALATKDRELSEWLANERAQDAAFSAILAKIEIPDDLREAIFDVLEGAQDQPAEFDADFVGALAAVRPPDGLREQILGAMEVEQKVAEVPQVHRRGFFRAAMWTTSVAAAIAVIVGVGAFFAGAGGNALAGTTPAELQDSAVKMLEDPFLSWDLENDRQAVLKEWLADRQLPVPGEIPPGLEGVRGIGCKLLKIGEGEQESKGSLVCFYKDGKKFHLITIQRDSVKIDKMAALQEAGGSCYDCPRNPGWAMTRWSDREHAYFLLGKMEVGQLAGLF